MKRSNPILLPESRSGLVTTGKILLAALIIVLICGLALSLSEHQQALQAWLLVLQPWLVLWRVMLYVVIACFWFYGLRQQIRKVAARWQVRRLEVLVLTLWVTVEGTLWMRSLMLESAL